MPAFLDPGAWGRDFASAMDGCETVAGLWIVGADMPQEGDRITPSAEVKDAHGLPAPNVNFDDHPDGRAMRDRAYARGDAIYRAIGATRTVPTPPYLSGRNRMSGKARGGMVDK